MEVIGVKVGQIELGWESKWLGKYLIDGGSRIGQVVVGFSVGKEINFSLSCSCSHLNVCVTFNQ